MPAASTTTVTSLEGKFVIDLNRKVGSGFSAEVYFVLSRKSLNRYALKLFHFGHEAEFSRELQVYKHLQSVPGVVKAVRSGVDPSSGRSYILMDTTGISLHEVINRMFKSKDRRPAMLFNVLVPGLIMQLKTFHEHGVLHRDIKPLNILLVPRALTSYEVHLIDVGDAELVDGNKWQIIEEKGRCGTPLFRSIYAHSANDLSYRDDIESLAYTLIFLLWWPKPVPWDPRRWEITDLVFATNDTINERMAEQKRTADLYKLCRGHFAVLELLKHARALGRNDKPAYQYFADIFSQ